MRNFKKFLALVLAMLMVSACAVSVSAYADQAAINATGYAEAVDVLSTLGVIAGDGTNFNLDDLPDRQQASVMVVRMRGEEAEAVAAYEAGEITFPFSDVDNWAKPYVAWLY